MKRRLQTRMIHLAGVCLSLPLLGSTARAAAAIPVTGETGGGVWVYVLVGLGVVLCIGAAVYLARGKKQ